jgi:hypothetical protein
MDNNWVFANRYGWRKRARDAVAASVLHSPNRVVHVRLNGDAFPRCGLVDRGALIVPEANYWHFSVADRCVDCEIGLAVDAHEQVGAEIVRDYRGVL